MTEESSSTANTTPAPVGNQGADTGAAPANAANEQEAPAKTFTQDDVERIVKERLDRANKKAEEKERLAQLSAEERAKEEIASRDQKLQQYNQRLLRAEAQAVLARQGVKAERIDFALRALDLSQVQVNDDGEVDTAAISQSVEALVKSIPELAVTRPPTAHPGNGPARPAGGMDAFIRRSIRGE